MRNKKYRDDFMNVINQHERRPESEEWLGILDVLQAELAQSWLKKGLSKTSFWLTILSVSSGRRR